MKTNLLRSSFLLMFAVSSIAGFSQSAELRLHKSPQGASVKGISPNGKWATGFAPDGETNGISPFLWDLETGSVSSIYAGTISATGNDVSDDGIVAGSVEDSPAVYDNGQWTLLPLPEKFAMGVATGISADGKVIIGYVHRVDEIKGTLMQTCKWVDRELAEMNVPLKDSRGTDATANKLEYISSDGGTILGRLNFIYPLSSTPVLWKEDSDPFFACEDIYYREDGSRNLTYIYNNLNLSGNGKFVTGYVAYDSGNPQGAVATFIYDTELKETTVYMNNNEASGFAVASNGVAYEAAGNTPMRKAYIRVDGTQTLLSSYLLEEYGFDIKTTGYKDLGTVIGVSDDCETLIGFEMPSYNWCLKLSKAPGATSVKAVQTGSVSVTVKDKIMTICGEARQVKLTDLAGKTAFEQQVTGNTVVMNNVENGVYILIIETGGEDVIRKIVVR